MGKKKTKKGQDKLFHPEELELPLIEGESEAGTEANVEEVKVSDRYADKLKIFLEHLELTAEEFSSITADPDQLQSLIFSSRWQRALRFMMYDETLQKLVWWFLLAKKKITPSSILAKGSDQELIEMALAAKVLDAEELADTAPEEKLTEESKEAAEIEAAESEKKCSCCHTHIWPDANHLPIQFGMFLRGKRIMKKDYLNHSYQLPYGRN